jgi:hypothetical protein
MRRINETMDFPPKEQVKRRMTEVGMSKMIKFGLQTSLYEMLDPEMPTVK